MIKFCTNCAGEFFARWRNDLALCGECRAGAVICSECRAAVRPPMDPRQLRMFADVERPPSRANSPTLEERYWSLRARASQATRRKYPYC